MGTNSQDAQTLGGPVSRCWQGEIGGVYELSDEFHATTSSDLEWLMREKATRNDVDDHWSKLRISKDNEGFQSPANLMDKSITRSLVSTLVACWSPQASEALPLKFRRSGELVMMWMAPQCPPCVFSFTNSLIFLVWSTWGLRATSLVSFRVSAALVAVYIPFELLFELMYRHRPLGFILEMELWRASLYIF